MKRSGAVRKSDVYSMIRGTLSPVDRQSMVDSASYVYHTNPKVAKVVDSAKAGAKNAAKKTGSFISSGAKNLASQMKASAKEMAMSNIPLQTSMSRSLQAEVNTLNSSTHRLLDELLKASPPRVGSSASVGGTSPASAAPPPASSATAPVGGAAPALSRPQQRNVNQQVASGTKGNQRTAGSLGTEVAPAPRRRAAAPVAATTAPPQASNSPLSGMGSTAFASYNAAIGNENAAEKDPALQVGVAGGISAPMLSGVTSAIQPRVGKSLFSGSWFNNTIMLD